MGHFISTKAVGSDERSDITHLYKYAEGIIDSLRDLKLMRFYIQSSVFGRLGTEQERIAVETACRYGSKAAAFSSSAAEDVSLKVSMDGNGPKMGQDADLSITMVNSSAEYRAVVLHSQVSVMYYTGVHKAIIGRDRTDVKIQPNEGKFRPED